MNFESTIYKKKALFNSLLSNELSNCRYRINARYEWKASNQIFSFRVPQSNVIYVRINLNIGMHEIFRDSLDGFRLNLIYRAYYISTYIHCLEAVSDTIPQSYFFGLALLCAINNLSKKKQVTSCSPIEKKPYDLQPIDIYCAIQGLTRSSSNYSEMFSEISKTKCDCVIENLLTYSMLPEIGYKKGKPIYSLLWEMKDFQQNVMKKRCSLDDFYFFSANEIHNFDKVYVSDLIEMSAIMKNPFWDGIILRLFAFSGESYDFEKNKDTYFINCIRQFMADSVKYYKVAKETDNLLLLANYTVVKGVSKKIETAFTSVTAESGMIHYYQ